MLVVDLVLKSLSRSKSFSLIFILNFSLAIVALAYLQFFKGSMESSLESRAKGLLGADLVVTSRFPIEPEQVDKLKKRLPKLQSMVEGVSTVSMIASKTRARLMEVVKLNQGYPFYGGLEFSDASEYPNGNEILQPDEVWVYEEVLGLLGLKLGGQIKIGKAEFTIKKVIVSDTSKAVSFSGFMPKVYLSQKGLEKSALLQFGSTATYSLHYLFQEPIDNDSLEKIEQMLEKNIDPSLRVLSPNDGRDRSLRVLNFITNFLSLVSLVSFFLGLVGLIYLYSGFLRRHKKDITVLNDLGLNKRTLLFTYLLHLFVLIFISSIVVFTLIALSAQFIGPMVQSIVDITVTFSLDYSFLLKSAFILLVLSLSVGIPLILPAIHKEKRHLFKHVVSYLPFIILLLLLSHTVSPVKYVGFSFAVFMLFAILFIFTFGVFLLNKFDFSGHLQSLSLSLALKNIFREKKTSLTLFTAIFLLTTLFSIIPQIGSTLSNALSQSMSERPRFFVIDAKEEQIEALKSQVESLGADLEHISPMVRGRVTQINGVDFKEYAKTRGDERARNSAVNLSYRSELKQSEKIIQGREFSGIYDSDDFSKPIELSVEKRYAGRKGIKLGDRLVFDVLGLELEAVVVNIRTVSWTEFVPNFFLILQEGAIDDAPKSLLATISTGNYDAQKMLLTLTERFPGLTIIDVKNLFESLFTLVQSVTSITDKMSFYAIVIGLLMSFIIIHYQMNLQKNNILRLKMIGVKHRTIRNAFLLEFGLTSFLASSLGIVLGTFVSYILSGFLFDAHWDYRPDLLLIYLLMIPALTLLVVGIFTSRIIGQKENVLFGE